MPVLVPMFNSSEDIVFALIVFHIIDLPQLSYSGIFNTVRIHISEESF